LNKEEVILSKTSLHWRDIGSFLTLHAQCGFLPMKTDCAHLYPTGATCHAGLCGQAAFAA
jgi:hypothetical protein